MCGRFVLRTPPAEVARTFRARGIPNKPPSWNVAPTHDVLAVALDGEPRERTLTTLRWGLIPSWAKDAKLAATMINAKAETVADKPVFRDAFAARRCIVPADAFYEWKREGNSKQAFAFVMRDRSLFGFAGLWERWRDPKSGETVRSCTVVTTTPNALCGEIHDRMPVILPPESYARWLGEEPADTRGLAALFAPFAADAMDSFPVSDRVGNVKNDDQSLMEPVTPNARAEDRQASLF